jgi:hypothetical protein
VRQSTSVADFAPAFDYDVCFRSWSQRRDPGDETALELAIGGRTGPIVTAVGGAVLKELGVTTPEQAVRKIETDPAAVARLARLEADRGPEWAAVALAEQRTARMLADRESEHRGVAYWWRPGGMYLNLYLWLQNTMLTPVLFNGVLGLQVSMIPWEHLIAFTALYCRLSM